jgi:hypothetical protein
MSTPDETTADWRPTGTSTRVVTAVTLATVAALLWTVPAMGRPVLVGVAGAGCLTLALWLLRTGEADTVTAAVVGLLVVPSAVGFLGSGVAAALLVTSRVFPVPSTEFVSLGILQVAGNVGVFLGCVLAVMGLALGTRNVLDPETLEQFVGVGLLAGVAPTVVTVLYVARGVLASGGGGVTPDLNLAALLSVALAPGTARLHLADFLLVVAAAAGLLAAALRALPVGELLADTGGGEATDGRVARAFYLLAGVAAVTAFLGLVFVPLELALSPDGVRSLLGASLYGAIRTVTTAGPLRLFLTAIAMVALLGLAAGIAVRTAARDDGGLPGSEDGSVPNRTGPVVAGVLVTVVAIAVASAAFETVVEGTADQLPEPVAIELRTRATESAAVYGEATFTVLLATMLIAAIVGLALVLRFALATGYLTPETAGYSLASAGLFVGVVSAATIDAPAPLVFGGIVASLLVWDAGQFGTVLGREVGQGANTRSTELVHAGATALVGVAGTVLAVVAVGQFQGGLGSDSSLTIVALVALVVGVTAFAAAIRLSHSSSA